MTHQIEWFCRLGFSRFKMLIIWNGRKNNKNKWFLHVSAIRTSCVEWFCHLSFAAFAASAPAERLKKAIKHKYVFIFSRRALGGLLGPFKALWGFRLFQGGPWGPFWDPLGPYGASLGPLWGPSGLLCSSQPTWVLTWGWSGADLGMSEPSSRLTWANCQHPSRRPPRAARGRPGATRGRPRCPSECLEMFGTNVWKCQELGCCQYQVKT